MIDINEGRTNNYLVQGVFLILGSFITLFIGLNFNSALLLIPAFLFVTSILLFAATNGLEIDVANDRYRSYGKIAGKKFGVWVDMHKPQEAVLMIHVANAEFGSGNLPVPNVNVKTMTYDIKLIDALGKTNHVYEFLDYKNAKRALSEIHNQLNIPIRNKVAEKLAANKRRR